MPSALGLALGCLLREGGLSQSVRSQNNRIGNNQNVDNSDSPLESFVLHFLLLINTVYQCKTTGQQVN